VWTSNPYEFVVFLGKKRLTYGYGHWVCKGDFVHLLIILMLLKVDLNLKFR
jgi:hypothetical protein